jgi:mRNA interferase MazF
MRGDILIVDYPFSDASQVKRRPALVIQADTVQSINTIVALITSNISRLVPERLVIDPKDELESGLRAVSTVACDSLATIHASLISKKIGSLSAATMQQIDECLKTALGLP